MVSTTVGRMRTPAGHRRRVMRHHNGAFGQHDIEGSERALIDRRQRLGERFIRDTGARKRSGIQSALPLLRAVGEVDDHAAAIDRDLGVNVDALGPGRRVVVEEGRGFVDAVLDLHDDGAAFGFGLVEDARHGRLHGLLAVALIKLVDATQSEAAGGDLRAQIAHRALREADIVADHLMQRLVEHVAAIELQLIELQAFGPGIRAIGTGAKAGARAADIDPMRAHHREQLQLALVEIGHVDDDVVEVLPGDGLVIHDDHVAGREAVAAVSLHAVGDDDAEIGDEMRHAADILAQQLAIGIDEGGTEIAHLVNHHVVGGTLQIGGHLVRDRRQRVANDLERHRIQTHRHRSTLPQNSVAPNQPEDGPARKGFRPRGFPKALNSPARSAGLRGSSLLILCSEAVYL